SGRRAFSGAAPADTLAAILHEDPSPIDIGSRPAPPAFERIVRRCLAKSPESRFHSAHDLALALEALRRDESVVGERAKKVPKLRAWKPVRILLGLAVGVVLLVTGLLGAFRPAHLPRITSVHRLTDGSLRPFHVATDGRNVYFCDVPHQGSSALFGKSAGQA